MTLPAPAVGTLSALAAGVSRFDGGRFFEAHEAWEEAWLAEDGPWKTLLQGLIQLAAAYHKGLALRSPSGMASLFAKAREKLAHVATLDPSPEGLPLAALMRAAAEGEALALAWAAGERDGFDPGAVTRMSAAFAFSR